MLLVSSKLGHVFGVTEGLPERGHLSYSLAIGTRLAHVATSTHDLIDEEQLLAKDGGDVQELSLDDVVIKDVGLSGGKRLASQHIHTESFFVFEVSLLDLDKSVLGVETRVLSQSAGHDQKGISEALNTKLGFSGNFLATLKLGQVLASSDLESTGTWDDSLVLDSVHDSAKTITDSILGLSDGVIVGSLDQDSARERVLDTLNEGVLIVTEALFVNELGKAEVALLNIIDGVELLATAGERDTLTVSALGTTDANDVVAGEDLEGGRVDTLLVDDNEVFVGAIAQALLQLNNLHDTVISELTLRLNQLLSLVGVGPEESGVDLGLLVLKRHVQAHDVAVLHAAWHV